MTLQGLLSSEHLWQANIALLHPGTHSMHDFSPLCSGSQQVQGCVC